MLSEILGSNVVHKMLEIPADAVMARVAVEMSHDLNKTLAVDITFRLRLLCEKI